MTEMADFAIWAKVRPACKREFRKWMARQTGWREIDVHSRLGGAVDAGHFIELFQHLGWEDAHTELGQLPVFVEAGSARLTVTSFRPEEDAPYCPVHSLYAWRLGCPVCHNNFIRRRHLRR